MGKPAIITVDDDAEVLGAVERDLRHRYAERYRVLRSASGATALDALRGLKKRNDSVGLLLVDQRMPEMTGVEFLGRSMEIYPDAKRVLLTAYADTDAAIRAINEAKIHHYLLKPWDPPEDHLYPVLDDLLEDWRASFRPRFEGVRVLGHRWSPGSYAVRDFLARNQVPYQWLDVETADKDAEVRHLAKAVGAEPSRLPMVLFPDGSSLAAPGATQLAERLGLRVRADLAFYDLVIVGGGPAGLAAAVYGASEGLKTVMIEREAPGGQAGMSSRIENYLGFPSGLSGGDLARRAVAQAKRFGVEILAPQEAQAVRVEGPSRRVKLADGSEIGCQVLLLAMGESLPASMSQYLGGEIKRTPSIQVETRARVVEVYGDARLEVISIRCGDSGQSEKVPANSLFVFIGAAPNTDWLAGVVERDERGFILTGNDLMRDGKRPPGWPLDRDPYLPETSVPGIFAVGDVRHGSVKRVASSVGEGSI